jgi:hypothetical protein
MDPRSRRAQTDHDAVIRAIIFVILAITRGDPSDHDAVILVITMR